MVVTYVIGFATKHGCIVPWRGCLGFQKQTTILRSMELGISR